MFSKYKVILFDFDDTLVESRIQKWSHHKETAEKFYNTTITDEELRIHWGKPFTKMVGELYKNIEPTEKIIQKINSIKQNFAKKEIPEAKDLINNLYGSGKLLGIISATNTDLLIDDLNLAGFDIRKFTFLQGADLSKYHKPNPKVFDNIIEQLEKNGIEKSDVVYIGDSIDDFNAANQAGLDFIAITTGIYKVQDFLDLGSTKIYNHIKEIL